MWTARGAGAGSAGIPHGATVMQASDSVPRLSLSPHLCSFLSSHDEASVQHLPLKTPVLVTSFSPPHPPTSWFIPSLERFSSLRSVIMNLSLCSVTPSSFWGVGAANPRDESAAAPPLPPSSTTVAPLRNHFVSFRFDFSFSLRVGVPVTVFLCERNIFNVADVETQSSN